MPLAFIQIIMVWHDGLECRVKWIDYYSDWFPITAGVRQGGVLSPDLDCLYVDDLINILKKLGTGCYIRSVFAAALFYADDMAVLSPSIKGLQGLLDVCASYCLEWDIKLNAKKNQESRFRHQNSPFSLCCPEWRISSLGDALQISGCHSKKWREIRLLCKGNSSEILSRSQCHHKNWGPLRRYGDVATPGSALCPHFVLRNRGVTRQWSTRQTSTSGGIQCCLQENVRLLIPRKRDLTTAHSRPPNVGGTYREKENKFSHSSSPMSKGLTRSHICVVPLQDYQCAIWIRDKSNNVQSDSEAVIVSLYLLTMIS